MAYGTIKVDNITFTNGGVDQTIAVSGVVQSISGDITATGTIQGATIIGTSTVSGATVTGDAGQFTTATITSGVFASGTAAAPSVSVGTTDNGIYSPGTDQVAISTNGTERLTIDSSGDVSLPRAGGGYMFQTGGSIRAGIRSNDNNELLFNRGTDSTEMVLTAIGLGVGTTSPATPLQVNTTSSGQQTLLRVVNEDATAGNSAGIDFAPANGLVGAAIYGYAESDFSTGAKRDGALTFHTRLDGGGIDERMRIDSSGRLLVGTSSSRSVGSERQVQIEGTTAANSSLSITTNSNAAPAIAPVFIFARTRGTSVGANTLVSSGDSLGFIVFAGADGTDTNSYGAWITAEVDGTPGANDMPGRLVFSTTADGASSPTERMRIKNNGDVTIGTTGSSDPIADGINATAIGAGTTSVRINKLGSASLALGRGTNNGSVIEFFRTTTNVGSVSVTTTATAYNTSSDYRLKENVTAVTDGIIRLQQLKPSRFNFIADPDTTVDGFLAHEVQDIVPEAITGEKDAVDTDGNPEYQGIDQSKLVPLLTAALQEAVAKIESLETRLTAAGI